MTKCYAHFEQVARFHPSQFIGIKEGYTESYWTPGDKEEKLKMKIHRISNKTEKGYRGITTLSGFNCESCHESRPGGGNLGIYAKDSADAEKKKIIEEMTTN